jgi:sulfane dehydrogenase subunit SoxC
MPGNGFPMRLLLPGYEGNMNVKFLRRIKLVPGPAMSFWESQVYTEPMPKGKSYNFDFLNEVKSFITRPSHGHALAQQGIYEISGIAYSGKGKIAKVMVSADGGKSWAEAALQEPVQTKAFTRFRLPWRWNGGPAILQSRAWEDHGSPAGAERIRCCARRVGQRAARHRVPQSSLQCHHQLGGEQSRKGEPCLCVRRLFCSGWRC